MALVALTGFELNNLNEVIDNSSGGASTVTSPVHGAGSYALKIVAASGVTTNVALRGFSSTTGQGLLAGAASVATTFLRFYFQIGSLPAGAAVVTIVGVMAGAATLKLQIQINSSGNLKALDSAGTALATGATVLSINTWYRIELKCATAAANAAWELKIGGASEISGANANTTASNAAEIQLGVCASGAQTNASGINLFYDDVTWFDSAYPGDGQIVRLAPNAVGTYQTWSTLSGTHPTAAGTLDGTNYCISDLVSADAETEATGAGAVSGTINAVQGFVIVVRDGAANGSVKHRLRSNAANTDTGTALATTAATRTMGSPYATNPNNANAAWALSDLSGIEVGCIEQSTVNKTRMYSASIFVDYVVPPATDLRTMWLPVGMNPERCYRPTWGVVRY